MLALALNMANPVVHFVATTPPQLLAAYVLLSVGWVPIFAVLIWGFAHLWLDYKEEQYEHHLHYINLEVRVPQGAVQTPKGMENFFSNLAGAKSGITWRETWLMGKVNARFSFEIISNGGRISFIIRTQDKYRDIIEADIYAQYPEAQITEVPDHADSVEKKYPNGKEDLFGAEIVLSEPEYFPIRTYDDFMHEGEKDNRFKDPLLPILEFMGKLLPHEKLWLQIIIKPPEDKAWIKAGIAFLDKMMGKPAAKHSPSLLQKLGGGVAMLPKEVLRQLAGASFGGGEKGEGKQDDFRMFKMSSAEKMQMDGVAEKISKVGWYVKMRYIAVAPEGKLRKGIMAAGMKGIFQPFSNPIMNSFGMFGPSITKSDYFWHEWALPTKQMRLAKRFKNRSFGAGATPFILNAEELASLWHFPAADARTPALAGLGARRSEAPAELPQAPAADRAISDEDWKHIYMQRRGLHVSPETHKADTHGAPDAHSSRVPHATHAAPQPPTPAMHEEAPSNLPM
jgi:hypothetical protein